MSSEATVSDIINNALTIANQKTGLIDAWANSSWITYAVRPPALTATSLPNLQFGGGVGGSGSAEDVRSGDMTSIADAVNGIERLPEIAFPTTVTVPNFQRYGAVDGGDPLNDDIIKIIQDLNQFSIVYGIDAIGPKLTTLFSSYMTTYFPGFVTEETGVADLRTIIAAQGYTMPIPAEDAIYQRSRDRIMNDGLRAEADALNKWAARGFTMPPGAAIMQAQTVRQDTQDKVAQAASDITVKQAELAVDMYKFALGQAIEYRVKALNAATEYLRIFTTTVMKQFTAEAYAAILEARNRMYGTSVELYKTMAQARELRVRVSQGERQSTQEAWRAGIGVDSELLRARSSAAIGAAEAVGHAAAAALSSINAVASLANVTSQ